MTDLDVALAATSPAPETARSVVRSDRKCRHPKDRRYRDPYIVAGDGVHERVICGACGRTLDDTRSRRGKSSRRLGADQERRIERVYGPRKVGEYGDAIDLLGRDFAWQSKATRDPMPLWLEAVDEAVPHDPSHVVAVAAAAMRPILGPRHPLVIQSWVHVGVPTQDRLWVDALTWAGLHGYTTGYLGGWLVMSGAHFLAIHGRDEG